MRQSAVTTNNSDVTLVLRSCQQETLGWHLTALAIIRKHLTYRTASGGPYKYIRGVTGEHTLMDGHTVNTLVDSLGGKTKIKMWEMCSDFKRLWSRAEQVLQSRGRPKWLFHYVNADAWHSRLKADSGTITAHSSVMSVMSVCPSHLFFNAAGTVRIICPIINQSATTGLPSPFTLKNLTTSGWKVSLNKDGGAADYTH